MHPVLAAAEDTLGVKLTTDGDLSLLDTPRRMLLVSRAQRNPQPGSPWLLATVSAATRIAADKETLVSGTGRIAYDAALFTAKRLNAAAIVVFANPNEIGNQELLPRRHLKIWPQSPIAADARAKRDVRAAWLSDRASAIYIRKAGTMSDVAALFSARGLSVDVSLAVHAPQPDREIQSELQLNQNALRSLEDRAWLTHFTREPDGAWPGETHEEYLGWLCSAPVAQAVSLCISPRKKRKLTACATFTVRDGFAALCRILEERRIRASGRLIAGRTPMVCFTEKTPTEILAQRRWRRGLLRWSFTPYALAVEKEALIERGAQAVRYAEAADMSSAPAQQRCFMQLKQSPKNGQDWTLEDEWRIAGDLDISAFDPRRLRALVTCEEEAKRVRQRFGIDAISLYL